MTDTPNFVFNGELEHDRAEVRRLLMHLGITAVEITYNGYDDSGTFEPPGYTPGPVARPESVVVSISRTEYRFDREQSKQVPVRTYTENINLEDLVYEMFDQDLESQFGGWENDDGANGSYQWDLIEDRIEHEHNAVSTSYDTTERTL